MEIHTPGYGHTLVHAQSMCVQSSFRHGDEASSLKDPIKKKLISLFNGSIRYQIPGAHEPPKAAKECVTTVLSKYKLCSQKTLFFRSRHSYPGWMSSLYCVLN